jgi:hypothetical protein
MVNGEETAGHLTGDCADVAGRRDRRPLLCAVVFGAISVTIPARAAYPHVIWALRQPRNSVRDPCRRDSSVFAVREYAERAAYLARFQTASTTTPCPIDATG